jgi:dephospho-CoA kinase
MIVGLTGGIATGKSTVSKLFGQMGAPIVDADLVARLVVEPDRPAWRDLAAYFGEEILLPDRTIDRAQLGALIFSDAEKRDKLNQIVHPQVRTEAERQIAHFIQEDPTRPVIYDVPLLIEAGYYQAVDKTIVVYVDHKTQLERLQKRNNLSKAEAQLRILAQMPIDEKLKYAHYIIDNRGTLADTELQVERVWKELTAAQ